MDMNETKKICKNALAEGVDPFKIIQEGITKAVSIIGSKFEAEEYFLPELIMAGEIIKQIMKILDPQIKEKTKMKPVGKIVIGTGKGDLHDIGKNIVKIFLEAEGFEVIDLGVDITPEKFIDAVRLEKPDILAISALISTTMPEVDNTIKALKKANLRNDIKIIIGGAPITQDFVNDVGGDAYAHNAMEGVKICKGWIKK
jgi:5-methyltetrahydrofolate--homocysteine methyltransferase